MFKEVTRSLDTGLLGIIGLIAFVAAFILIVVRVMLMKKSERENAKNIPLEDDVIEQRPDTN
jgi:hypothetical protein